jgi:hypothetical protein
MKKIFCIILSSFLLNVLYSQKTPKKWCTVGDQYQPPTDGKTNTPGDLSNARLVDPNGVIIIPVVFHILYNLTQPGTNVSDFVIQSQVTRLNTDFRKLNSDISLLPPVWTGLAADMKIEFRLACIDPNDNPTNGIIHKQTTVDEFWSVGADEVNSNAKLSVLGGDDAWPTDNIPEYMGCQYEPYWGHCHFTMGTIRNNSGNDKWNSCNIPKVCF